MSGWQTMKTAPKDGTVVDLWTVYDEKNKRGGTGRLAHCRWSKRLRRWWWLDGYHPGCEGGCYVLGKPTHWRAIPKPPVQLLTKNTTRKRAAKKSK